MFSFKYKVAEVVYQHWFLPKHCNVDAMNMMEFMYSLYRKSRKRKLRCDEKWESLENINSELLASCLYLYIEVGLFFAFKVES